MKLGAEVKYKNKSYTLRAIEKYPDGKEIYYLGLGRETFLNCLKISREQLRDDKKSK